MIATDIINGIGVSLILCAFFLQMFQIVSTRNTWYLALNLLGSALACYGSWLIGSIPFMILEGTWCLVSFTGLCRLKMMPAHI
jgi:uncharacterized protein with PQ loop repeat